MDEGNEFKSIEMDDFESTCIENMDLTPKTVEDLSLIMDEEIQGLSAEELMIPDDDFLEGDLVVQDLVTEEIPDELLGEIPNEYPEETFETIDTPMEELMPDEIPAEENVLTWMDDVAIESTEEIELMDDDVELTDNETVEGLIEETAEVEETVLNLENVSGWLKEINPNFDPFDLDSPYCNNCGSCAHAVYLRLEGISTDSSASAENIGYNSEMEVLTGMEQVSMSPAEIEEQLLEQGDGAHAIIGIDRMEGPGHWFNAACLDGKVVAIDGQSGEIFDWPPDYGDVTNWEMSIKKGDR